jgi:ABC-2 type transport system ATP-binding protein
MTVIEVTGGRKTYTRFRRPPEKALDGLDLVVEAGGVHGFLGPNGSGKTTTIRMLLGLVGSDGGELRVFDRQVPQHLPEVTPHIGALVETPLFFPSFSGRLNLQVLADVAGVSRSRVEEVLETVDLGDRADDRFKSYSLGMKQRLGIAAALLKRPRLLILDEPSNGLDPAGIREVRELLRRLGSDGHTTVFLSSHLLGEVQQVCDHVTILARGRRVAHGRVADVLAASAGSDVRLRVDDPAEAQAVLEAAGYRLTSLGDAWAVHDVTDPSALNRTLVDAGHYLSELSPMTPDLESVFLDLTNDPGTDPSTTDDSA